MDKIRLIQIGLGRWGFDWARDILPGHQDIEVVAYVDSDAAALQRAQLQLGVSPDICFADTAGAFGAVAADAAVICLPIALHAPVARDALEAGLHVVVEKPFTATLREAYELANLAEARSRVLMVSQNYRYFPASVTAADFVRKGSFGRLCQIKIDFRRNAPVEGYQYWGLPDPLLVDMAVHHYDLTRMITGEDPVELSCRTWNPPASRFTGDPCGAIVLTFPSGVVVSYRGSWLDQGEQTAWAGEWQMDFEHGSMLWTSRGDRSGWIARDRVATKRPNEMIEEQKLPAMQLFDRRGVLAAFASVIRSGQEPPYFPSGRSNIPTLAVIEAALKSAATAGASVRIADVLAAAAA